MEKTLPRIMKFGIKESQSRIYIPNLKVSFNKEFKLPDVHLENILVDTGLLYFPLKIIRIIS